MKKIAFSILNRNGLIDTISCINSLLASEFQDFDIYLLDNGSKDINEFEVLKGTYWIYKNIIIGKSSTNLWFTGGNNYNLHLIEKKNYDYICLFNNDCYIEKWFLWSLIYHIDSLHQDAIYGPVIKNLDGTIQSCGSKINLWLWTNPRIKNITWPYKHVDCVSGSCFIISWKVFKKVWLLDDRYFAYREESDYCMRTKKAWYPIISLNIDGVIHKEETANNKKKPYYTYLMFRNRILFLRKHANRLQYIVSRGVLIIYMIVIFPRVFGLQNYKQARKGIQDGLKV